MQKPGKTGLSRYGYESLVVSASSSFYMNWVFSSEQDSKGKHDKMYDRSWQSEGLKGSSQIGFDFGNYENCIWYHWAYIHCGSMLQATVFSLGSTNIVHMNVSCTYVAIYKCALIFCFEKD